MGDTTALENLRTVSVEIAGESFDMPVSYQAGQQLEAAGYDPLNMAIRARRVAEAGGAYPLTAGGVITVLAIGVKAAKSKLTREQLGQAVYTAGVMAYLATAMDYLAAFVTAEPEFPVPQVPDAGKNPEAE